VSKGYSIEEILNTSVRKAGDASVISIAGEYQTRLTPDTTIGMQLLTASYDLAKQYGDFQKHIYEEYGVDVDPETLSMVIGTILTGQNISERFSFRCISKICGEICRGRKRSTSELFHSECLWN